MAEVARLKLTQALHEFLKILINNKSTTLEALTLQTVTGLNLILEASPAAARLQTVKNEMLNQNTSTMLPQTLSALDCCQMLINKVCHDCSELSNKFQSILLSASETNSIPRSVVGQITQQIQV